MSVSMQTPSFDAPIDVTRTPVDGSLAHRLATGSTVASVTFAGQGWPWWEDLAALLERRSWLRPRAARWARMIAELVAEPEVRDLGGSPSPFDPLAWVDAPDAAPSPGELAAMPLSMPGVLLTQLLAYREAWEDALAGAVDAGSIAAVTGHSGGLIAAAAVSSQPAGLEDDDALVPYLRLAVLIGHVVGSSELAVAPAALDGALRGEESARTPMLAVGGVRLDRLSEIVDELGSVRIALRHGPSRAVLSGAPEALAAARATIDRRLERSPGFGTATWEPLAVSAPCHHPVLQDLADRVIELSRAHGPVRAGGAGVSLVSPNGPSLLASGTIATSSNGKGTGNGSGTASGGSTDVTDELVAAMLTRQGSWDAAVSSLVGAGTVLDGLPAAEWVLDLGPSDGVARLAAAAVRGTGARVLPLTEHDERRRLVTAGALPERPAARYEEHLPRVVALPDGTNRIENRFTLATGRSPIVLAGMTPTTVDAPIVAAAANAGFVAELAGGGQVTEEILTERLRELGELLEPGQEVVFNALHLDPYLWGLHLGRARLVQAARSAGAPICGVTISAGIPETDDAVALLDELNDLGMWCNAFKPGTLAQIRQVVAIADAAPQHTIFVHVEGGTAGGHHSWVDLEDLLLGGYHELRSRPNVVVCAGGGIGTPERAAELLDGSWSLRHVATPMPVDAVLLGTAAMAVAEATATASVKEALARAAGRPATGADPGFVATGRVDGAVTSGRSGLDADIHFLDNSASRCARLLDEVAGDADVVERRRDEIVEALSATAKPYFGDVAEMTYEQLLRRFVELTAIGRHGRYEDGAWLDVSHRSRFLDLLHRAEARLHPSESGRIPTMFPDDASVDDPGAAIDRLVAEHPHASTTLLHPADPTYFRWVCKAAGKPVPFVPVIDADVRRWYQSDSLWQAQHPAYDADQVLIIPGPAAVGGILRADEPVADLLGRFEGHLGEQLLSAGLAIHRDRRRRSELTREVSGPVAALLDAATVLVDGRIVPNPVQRFRSIGDWTFEVDQHDQLTGCWISVGDPDDPAERVRLDDAGDGRVTLTLTFPRLAPYGDRAGDAARTADADDTDRATHDTITLTFQHRVLAGVDVLELDTAARATALRQLLVDTLVRDRVGELSLGQEHTLRVPVDGPRRAAHARLVGAPSGEPLADGWLPLVWPAVFTALGAPEIVAHLLDLVHLEHRVTVLGDPADADVVEVGASVTSMAEHPAGTRVDTTAEVRAAGATIARVEGAFLLRGVQLPDSGPAAALDRRTDHPDEQDEQAQRDEQHDEAEVVDRPRLTLGRRTLRAPASMDVFAAVSGDHNPIHRSVVVAALAGMDGPIAHGAWTSAAAQAVAIETAAAGRPERLTSWSAQFVAPVLPGEELSITVTRTGARRGGTVIEVAAVVQRDEGPTPAMTATATVAPPTTAYLFPGQGIQRPGMGMDGYERSAAARRVWDRADAHTRERLGFSILSVVRDNPTTLVADGEVHRHPAGVLHLTQFTQVAMAALASAQVAELREEGAFDENAICAGHSVGEYNALAAVAGVLELEVVVELVFRRGQAMHHLVPRDADGNSDYRLGVIRPHMVGMDHAEVDELVGEIRDQLGQTLEIVNYNLRGKQYAVAGTIAALDELDRELQRRARPGSRPAFLYVPGIDVPFHSSVLRDGVEDFRRHLDAGLPERIDPELLVGRYVPNLVPRLFTLERDYVEEVADYVGSARLRAMLEDWSSWESDPGRLCRELLVELLAWQFASPVRWIETQDLLFDRVGRVVEVGLGSQPTVANLAKGTLALDGGPAAAVREIQVLNVEGDRPVVFALDEDPVTEPDEPEADPATDAAPDAATPPEAAAPAPAAPAPSAPAATGATGTVADLPVTPGDALRRLLAVLVKVRPDQLSGTESIDDLVDGVSSRRNQVLMDLGTEFAVSGVDGARELALDLLVPELTARAGRYSYPGPVLRDARDAALAPVLGPRRLKVRDVAARVTGHWQLGDGWVERVLDALAFDGRDGDSARGGPLGRLQPLPSSGDDAIDAAVQLAAADAGVALPTPGAGGGGAQVDAAAVADLEDRIAGPDGLFADVAREVLARVAPEPDGDEPADTSVADRLALLEDEHGARRASNVAPRFDARRHVAFTSWWATARHDVVELHHAGLRGDVPSEELDAEARRLSRAAIDPGVRASASWFRDRAAERGDEVAAARFSTILDGTGSPVPVPSLEPSIEVVDGAPRPVELDAPAERLAGLIDGHRSAGQEWSATYADELERLLRGSGSSDPSFDGATFASETALVTGASPGSIALEVVGQLLAGGATVVCTTTNDSPERLAHYRELYRTHASPGAELHVVPANLASFADVDAVVDWMVAPRTETAAGVTRTLKDPMRPTLVLPFAAGPVAGDLVDAGPDAEVAMRVLLWGVQRLVGRLAEAMDEHGSGGRRIRVVLPLSPNHGGFGGDGAYGEAKAALEVFTEKWASEQERWGHRVDLVAATIGWVRGTGLMDANDALAALVERDLGVRTCSSAEMGWQIAALCTPAMAAHCKAGPLRADLSGGLAQVGQLRTAFAPLTRQLEEMAQGAATEERSGDTSDGGSIDALLSPPTATLSAPASPQGAPAPAAALEPTVPLEQMVVVVGAAELGPWGGSATRFDLEVHGELADGSVAELAWLCGLVRWDSDLDGGSWVDTESGDPVAEAELAERYRDEVHEHCGIRTFDGRGLDPEGVDFMVEAFCESDAVVTVGDEADARAFAAADPANTTVRMGRDGDWQVVRKAGSSIRVPRRAELTRRVGAQIPRGFDPTNWGIPAEMAASVDRLSLWNLIATVEAFLDAGIEPEELMAKVHPARVGNTQGSGMGGMTSIQTLYRDAVLGGDHANDLLQEGLGNVIAAYVVQSYVGSYGPMVHPVAACATAAVSIEDAVDKIRAGKADVVVAGGWDDLELEGVLGFGSMSATAATDDMEAAGLEPRQFSRANDRRRAGFVEAQGGGSLLLARGSVAAELGLPIRGVVVYAGSFADGIHTSIPAPGLGALGCVLGGERSALATALAWHGLRPDDIAVVSKHDTSTAANDPNESELHHQIATTLGRSEGNPMLVVSQKTVTGHAKGGAAAWQSIGLLQILESGEVPGNRNLECLDESHRDHTHLAYGHRSITAGEPLRAGLLTSLGFGHVSAVVCLAHPEVFEAALAASGADAVAQHRELAAQRRRRGRHRRAQGIHGIEPLYTKRVERRLPGDEHGPAAREAEVRLLTDARVRLGEDGTYGLPADEERS